MKRVQGGFTLIEVMVAIALMAVVAIISWRGLENVSAMQHRLAGDADEIESIIRMLGQIERDLAMRAPDTLLDGGAESGTPPKPAATLPQSLRITFKETPDASATLEIIRSDAGDPAAWQRVVWFLDGTVLRRAAGPSARQYPLPPAAGGAAILQGVTRFALRVWVPGQGWTNPPFPTTGAAFTGLELAAERRTDTGVERYRRVVVLQ
ncbi:MAG: prepilin-type N-terminal cleavage/methylation domain-containing protein [Pigmentiphaga sp.]|uniref:PulJ/GspJ family protein n=1 Tax=Pigmentiphaga sp. TaxID=1977564 RepID=UPI0029B84769|nr:prepilin-type N-terminal cleavage/methylation domain-containing protein [Pigmentiphaga sp.]MDX3908154.1 prepilin-type N-terminal cleavage/methylation domain-containing protein [Pigmentiphaga sp.]